jgi:hypothetical protein
VLFDLQSPRRRRVVRITFGALAAVFAISFVLLGVGTGGSGFSISDLFGGGGGGSSSSAFNDDINTAEQQAQANPQNPAPYAQLVQLRYSKANTEADSQGRPTSDSVQDLQLSAEAWSKYLKLAGAKPARGPALIAYQTYFVLAQADFADATSASTGSEQLQGIRNVVADLEGAANAQKVVAQQQPNLNNWAKVAEAFALAGNTQGTQQALAEAKKADPAGTAKLEKQLKNAQQQGARFQQVIQQLTKQQQQQAQSGAGGGATGGASGATAGAGGNPLSGLGTGGGFGGAGGGL